jgi:hypothetical protein
MVGRGTGQLAGNPGAGEHTHGVADLFRLGAKDNAAEWIDRGDRIGGQIG